MLTSFFMICAIGGGAFVVAQLLLSIFAFGFSHGFHLHHGSAGGHASAPRIGPRGGFFRHGPGRSYGGPPRALPQASAKSIPPTTHGTSPQSATTHDIPHWAAHWLLGLFTIQGLAAGAAVLGLSGLAATAAKLSPTPALAIALGAAFLMMVAVAVALEFMASMEEDGTIRIEEAIGQIATVYLSIPVGNQGQGKITLTLQQQLMEFPAVTGQDTPLATGQKVIVIAIKPSAVMEVISAEKHLRDLQA